VQPVEAEVARVVVVLDVGAALDGALDAEEERLALAHQIDHEGEEEVDRLGRAVRVEERREALRHLRRGRLRDSPPPFIVVVSPCRCELLRVGCCGGEGVFGVS